MTHSGTLTVSAPGGCQNTQGVNGSGLWIFTRKQHRDEALLQQVLIQAPLSTGVPIYGTPLLGIQASLYSERMPLQPSAFSWRMPREPYVF